MRVYYNDHDPYCVQWLRNLIEKGLLPDGDVDDRDIRDVRQEDLRGYRQVHFFAGLGGWPYALRLAEWPSDREVWTGSCPCQPFSSAGAQRGHADERHLWPAFYGLISECRPPIVFGEQVAGADGREWLSAVRLDLEAAGYAVGAADLPAAGVGAWHARQRLWLVANAADGLRREIGGSLESGTAASRREAAQRTVREGLRNAGDGGPAARDWWAAEPNVGRVADGVSVCVDQQRALGNAIVPQVAAEFISAARDAIGLQKKRTSDHG